MKIIADEHIPYVKEYFSSYGELILKSGREISHADVKDADILLVRSVTQVDEKLLSDTKIKFVGSITAGRDHLDKSFLNEANIDWGLAHGFNAPPVSDYVVSVVAALRNHTLFKQNKKTAVVIGVGNVGRLVQKNLKLLNFDVMTCDPFRAEDEHDFESIPLEDIANVDLITLHVPLTQKNKHPTYHFIEKNFLKRQKENCILLNASRGSVINSNDLMQYGEHLKWCLDVWEHEPHINLDMLQRATIATPHIAGYSIQSKIRGVEMIYQTLIDKKILPFGKTFDLKIPKQHLTFSENNLSWQDIVMRVFNPLLMTDLMRLTLLSTTKIDQTFDEMRSQFTHRYEFAFSKIKANVSADDKNILEKLGFEVE